MERHRNFDLPPPAIQGNDMGSSCFSIMESFDFFANNEVHPQKEADS